MGKIWVGFLGQEDPLEKEMATHYSILAWRIQGQMSLAGYSPWGCKSWTPKGWMGRVSGPCLPGGVCPRLGIV